MSYAIRLGSAEPKVFRENTDGTRKLAFNLSEVKAIIDSLLTRKMRNNGIGRHLVSRLLSTGNCTTHFRSQSSETYGFAWNRSASDSSIFELRLIGDYPQPLLRLLNRPCDEHAARIVHKKHKEERRVRRRALSHIRPKGQVQRTIVGDNGNLRQHFKNTSLVWGMALRVVARAARMSVSEVENQFLSSMIERGAATLRIKTTFVLRVNLGHAFTGTVALSEPVSLWTTKDNAHPVYRRLRKALRNTRSMMESRQNQYLLERLARHRTRNAVSFAA